MKKFYLSALILVATVFTASAQLLPSFQFGLKAGANFATIKDISLSSSTRTGYQFGVWTRIGGAGMHLQPELYVTSKGASLKGDDGKLQTNFTSLDLPILVGTKIGIARVQAGPVISFVMNEDNKLKDAIGELGNFKEYKNQTIGLTGGVGVDFMKFRGDLRYEHGLTDVFKGGDEKGNMSLWTLSVGYRIF